VQLPLMISKVFSMFWILFTRCHGKDKSLIGRAKTFPIIELMFELLSL